MHGRVKVRTTEEQKQQKHKEQQHKLAAYRAGMKQILATRNKETYNKESFYLSGQLLSVNPDIYTLWNYRKEVVLFEEKNSKNSLVDDAEQEKFIKFLEDELKLTFTCLSENPKSYSSWHHRYWILLHHPKPNWQHEFDLCSKYLSIDGRNFHCWDYRRLIVNQIGITLVDEIKFTTDQINVNFSNYSAWHYRSTLRKLDDCYIESELMLVQSAVFTDPDDSSAWFYLRWVLSQEGITIKRRKELLRAINELYSLDPECKWILMAKCWLTSSLLSIDENTLETCIENYKQLIKIDSLREGHYKNLLKIFELQIREY